MFFLSPYTFRNQFLLDFKMSLKFEEQNAAILNSGRKRFQMKFSDAKFLAFVHAKPILSMGVVFEKSVHIKRMNCSTCC